jgi:hypothetical protein
MPSSIQHSNPSPDVTASHTPLLMDGGTRSATADGAHRATAGAGPVIQNPEIRAALAQQQAAQDRSPRHRLATQLMATAGEQPPASPRSVSTFHGHGPALQTFIDDWADRSLQAMLDEAFDTHEVTGMNPDDALERLGDWGLAALTYAFRQRLWGPSGVRAAGYTGWTDCPAPAFIGTAG